MDIKQEITHLRQVLPVFIIVTSGVLILTAVKHGAGTYLIYLAAGLLAGLPLLDIDKLLHRYLNTSPDLFHGFQIYLLLFVLALFTITASDSLLGKGMVISMMVHNVVNIKDSVSIKVGYGLLGLILVLLIFF